MAWSTDPARRRHTSDRTLKAFVTRRDAGVCYICHHTGGTMDLDHIANYKRWIDEQRDGDPDDPSNLALAHSGYCPVCNRQCHKDKTRSESKYGSQRMNSKLHRRMPKHPGTHE